MAIVDACQRFEQDAKARKLSDPTRYKYTVLFRQLKEFATGKGIRFLAEIDVDALTAFRAGWNDGSRSSAKKLGRLRTFLRFSESRKWINSNPARKLKAPRFSVRPTLPFTSEEMPKILGDGLSKYAE